MREIGASLRRHWLIALTIAVLIPISMALYLANRDTTRPPARYTTSVDILIPARDPDSGDSPQAVPPVLLQGQTELASSRSVRDVALQMAGLDPDADLNLSFDARLSPSASIMTLSVSAPEPALAADVLEEYITAFEDGRRQSVLDAALERADIQARTIQVLRRRITAVETELFGLGVPIPPVVPDGSPVPVPAGAPNETTLLLFERNALLNEKVRREVDYSLQITTAAIPGGYTTVVQRRSAARIAPPPPSPLVPLLQILGIGLLLAIGIPVAYDRLDSTITEARAAPGALRAATLGTIPALSRRLEHGYARPGSTWDAAFRSLAATAISTDRLPKALMVSSPTGTTHDTVAANFASALAGLGVRVALIGTVPRQGWFLDTDYVSEEDELAEPEPDIGPDDGEEGPPAREPAPPRGVTTFPDLLADAGAGVLTGDIRPRLATRIVPNLYVVPPGDEDLELSLDGLPPLLDVLARSEIDVTVIAGPAFLEDPNATIIAWSTRHVLWALEISRVNTRDAQLAAERLELAGVEPFGIAIVERHT